MHLQINLSNDVIKQWKPTLSDTPPETDPLLCWRLDRITLGRKRSNYICVNESTLFSFVITDLSGKKPIEIQQRFLNEFSFKLQELHYPAAARNQLKNLPILFGKTQSRKTIGCATDLKKGYQLQHEYADSHDEMERRVNNTPYPTMGIHSPMMACMALRRRYAQTDPAFICLSIPENFVYAARRAFDPWPLALESFDTDKCINGIVEAYLSPLELSELGARLMAGPDRAWALNPGDTDNLKSFYQAVMRVMNQQS